MRFLALLALLSGPALAQGAAASAPAPLQSWSLGNCRAAGGAAAASLRAGQAATCELSITSVRAGAAPVSATFRYELKYQEGGKLRSLVLEGTDTWRSGGRGNITFVQRGNRMTFSLPLSVRRRDPPYTALTVVAELTFADGSRRRVYDTLPVR